MEEICVIELDDVEALTKAKTKTKFKPVESTDTDDIDRDGENVGNKGRKDYFGKRDKAGANPKTVPKELIKPSAIKGHPPVLKKSDYFGIYMNRNLGGEAHSTITSGPTSVPVIPVGGPAEREVEQRPATQGTDVAAVNQDAYDKATQGGLVRLQRGDMEVSYMSVATKADGHLLGYGGSTSDRAEFAAGQGDQSQLKSVPVLGVTDWTVSIIPPKVLKKSNPSVVELFKTSPEDTALTKSISQGNLVEHNHSVQRAEVNNPGNQKYYDYANVYIRLLHKSFKPDHIYSVLKQKSEANKLLAKSIQLCGIDEDYVSQAASFLCKENNSIGASGYEVQKVLSQFA